MDAAGPAEKLWALDAELAAKSSRVAELEARVSLLESENARLRKALARGESTGRTLTTGERDPKSARLAAGSGGNKHEEVEKPGGSVACDVIEVSDDEEGAAVDAKRGRSPEVGFVAVQTPRKRAVRAVTGESEDEDDAEGGGGSSKENSVGLEDDDDDVLAATRGKKRAAARVVTSDSEDEDVNDGEVGSGKDGVDHQEGVVKPSKKRGLCGIGDSEDESVDVATSKAATLAQIESGEDEDDMVPICRVLRKMRKERVSGDDDDDDELGEAKGCSTPATRRSARFLKNQSKGGRAARRALNFVEPKDYEVSEDDMEEDDDMEEFINDEDDSSENASDSAEESCDKPEVSGTSVLNEESSPGLEESDDEVDYAMAYADVMARIGRKNKAKDWKFEGDMLAAFDEHPELCLKAVCALYRKQTEEEQVQKATFIHNKQGFNHVDALRGSVIAEFLLDGDLYGPLKKTISDLEEYDRYALGFCRKVASRYSKQLFAIYQNKEDPYFHP